PVHPALGEGGVAETGEAVVVAEEVVAALLLELARQPLAPVEADLDVEGEPGLEAGAHEAEDRVSPVLVDVQALARPQAEPPLGAVLGAVVLEAHAGLDDGERADEAPLDRVLLEQAPCEVLLARRGELQVAHGAVELGRLGERRLLDALAG